MKSFIKILMVGILVISALWSSETLNLMPVPYSVELTGGKLYIGRDFRIEIKSDSGDDLYAYATRVLRRLDERTGLCFSQDVLVPNEKVSDAILIVETQRKGEVKLYEDESYQLIISKNGLNLMAETDIGAMRGLETMLQLLDADKKGYYFPCLTIRDEPRFPWRGLMIDVARHFHDVNVIKRNIDGMAAVKMNVLHLHLSDDQGFRVESNIYPKLHEIGGEGFYFTHEQIREILRYAEARGIRVVPEFDVPAHTTAMIAAYPELGSSDKKITLERGWGVKDPVLNPTKEFTYTFLDKLFGEMAALFPDEYFHIGGDENNGVDWSANQDIQTFMNENNITDNHALQTHFNKKILKILTRHNKKMIGWDEILQPDLPKESVVHSWRGNKYLVKAARNGYQTILSRGYYIDLVKPTTSHYNLHPVPADSNLTAEEQKNILGGEATMWAEFTDSDVVDSRIWPRAAAIAERFWSPAEITDADDMYRRLETVSFHLEELGLTHICYQEKFMRRLTNNQDTKPLKTLVDVIEMLKVYERHQTFFESEKYQTHTPLTRVVDVTIPDQPLPRKFNKMVDQYIESGFSLKYEQEIVVLLDQWQKNDAELKKIAENSPVLNEILPMSEKLKTASETGIQAMEYIKKGKTPSKSWQKKVMKKLVGCKEQVVGTELMIVKPIEKLVQEITK